MNNILEILTQSLHTYLKKTFALTPEDNARIGVDLNDDPKKAQFGDITTNAALIIAKIAQKNPRVIAEQIASEFSHELIEKIEIAGPGFVNITLTDAAFNQTAKNLFLNHTQFFKLGDSEKKINFNIEFVSANPTGPLHIGHGRGGIMGDVLGNVISFLGHPVTKEFYINDAGNQIQKLGNSFKIRCLQLLGQPVELPENGYQGEYLKELAEAALKENPTAIEQALAENDNNFFARYAKDYLLEQLKTTLSNYGITFDVWFSEKTLHESGAIETALKVLEKNKCAFIQDDALWFKSTGFGDDKDRVLKRSNGEVTYAAADVAYLQNKIDRGAEQIIMILGQDHHSYVQRMKGIMQALGHNPDNLDAPIYQLVTLKESGEQLRMSKRAGRMITLHDVIQTVGTDVARFFYLNRKADAHLEFDIDLAMKRTEENPVYYIQYAYVRTKSILEKASEHPELKNITEKDSVNLNDHEKRLFKKILNLKVLLQSISKNYHTHLLTYYLLELAHAFHSYYGSNRVINVDDIPTSRSRLAIIIILQKTFELCMQLLGISCPEKM